MSHSTPRQKVHEFNIALAVNTVYFLILLTLLLTFIHLFVDVEFLLSLEDQDLDSVVLSVIGIFTFMFLGASIADEIKNLLLRDEPWSQRLGAILIIFCLATIWVISIALIYLYLSNR